MSQSQSQTQQSRNSAQFQLRLPDDLKARIQEAADASGRSTNTEIVIALHEKFSPALRPAEAVRDLFHYISDAPAAKQAARLAEVNAKLDAMGSPLRVQESEPGKFTITLNA